MPILEQKLAFLAELSLPKSNPPVVCRELTG